MTDQSIRAPALHHGESEAVEPVAAPPAVVSAAEPEVLTEWGTRPPAEHVPYRRHTRGAPKAGIVKGRPISNKLDHALHLHALEGLSQEEAATRAGITRQALNAALKRPHVVERRKEIWQDYLAAEGVKSVKRMSELRDQNENKTVALDASVKLAALAGISPPDRRGPSGTGGGPGVMIVIRRRADRGVDVGVRIDGEGIDAQAGDDDEG